MPVVENLNVLYPQVGEQSEGEYGTVVRRPLQPHLRATASKCFIVDYPKKREIFAAMFRDRIVHHLYFNYTHAIYERTFIADAYSCIKGRGTHYGINRARLLPSGVTELAQPCYVMHLDIRGYFMHIDRQRLLDIALRTLHRKAKDKDLDFLCWLTRIIAMLDPRRNCIIVGDPSNWDGLDPAKSMLHLKDGLGLPIGNLTSQLFSNVYLNEFDQFMKRTLKCRYYGRYVDDAFVVSADREWLMRIVPDVQRFLKERLGVELHMGKAHHRGGAQRRGVSWFIHQALSHIYQQSCPAPHRAEGGASRFQEAVAGGALSQFLSRHLPAHRLDEDTPTVADDERHHALLHFQP